MRLNKDRVVTLNLGYGRTAAGRVGDGVGVNVNPLRRSSNPWITPGATLAPTGVRYRVASTQHHWTMENRPLAREASLEHYREHPHFTEHLEHDFGDLTLYTDREYGFEGFSVIVAGTGSNSTRVRLIRTSTRSPGRIA